MAGILSQGTGMTGGVLSRQPQSMLQRLGLNIDLGSPDNQVPLAFLNNVISTPGASPFQGVAEAAQNSQVMNQRKVELSQIVKKRQQEDQQSAQLKQMLAGDPMATQFLLAGQPDEAMKIYAKNKGLDLGGADGGESYFGNGIPIENQDGSISYGQFGNKGGFNVPKLPTGSHFMTPVQQLNTGTAFTGVDKFGNQTGGTTPIDNRGAAADTAQGKTEGERAGDLPVLKSKAMSTIQALDTQHGVVNQDIDRAVSAIQSNPWFTSGPGAALTSWAPSTPGQAVAELLTTIKGNIGFDKLQQMRENSPTGGALGQVSDFENRQLQSVMGSLEQSNNTNDLLYNLRRLKDLIGSMGQERQDAFSRDFGAGAGGGGAPDPLGIR